MLETKRLFRDTRAVLVLVLLSVLGLLLYFSGQLEGAACADYQEKNSAYHAVLREANSSGMDYDYIHQRQQDLTLRAVFSNPDSPLYDFYREAYPDYAADTLDESGKKAVRNEEWAYVQLDQQAAYQSAASGRLERMEAEFTQKSGSKLFSRNRELLRSMEKTLRDYQALGAVGLSYGDDRLVLSVLQNRGNIALLLILLFFGCFQMYLPKEQALHAVITSTRRGRRPLKASGLLSLCVWTAVSQLAILVPQFTVSWFLYDGNSQWNRTIQSLEPFSDFLVPCTVPQFLLLYTGYAVCLSCFVAILFWTVMNLSEHLGTSALFLSVLVWLSYACYTMNGNSKYVVLKYCNLVSCLAPMDLIRQYRLVNMAGLLINMPVLTLAAFILASVVFAALVLLKSGKPYPSGRANPVRKLLAGIRKRIIRDIQLSPSLWEHVKLVTEGRTILVLAAAVFFALSFQVPPLYLGDDDLVKQAYYEQLSSVKPEEAESMLAESLSSAEEKIQQLVQRTETDKQLDFVAAQMLAQYSTQRDVLEILLSEADEMKAFNAEHKNQEVFFDSFQADALFGSGEKTSGRWRILALILLVIFLSSVCFPLEKQSGTVPLIICSRKGIARIYRKKVFAVWLEVLLVALCFAVPEGIRLAEKAPVYAAVQSIPCLKDSLFDLSIAGYWGLLWGCRLLVLLGISSLVMLFSLMLRTVCAGIVMSESIFGLPNMLPVLFPSWNMAFLPFSVLQSYMLLSADMTVACITALVLCILLFAVIKRKSKATRWL